jgi:hypothetical protein
MLFIRWAVVPVCFSSRIRLAITLQTVSKALTWKITSLKPRQNAYIESFNGKFRDECLNQY